MKPILTIFAVFVFCFTAYSQPATTSAVKSGSLGKSLPPGATPTAASASSPTSTSRNATQQPRAASGSVNSIAKFIDSSGDLGNSSITEVNGNVGISAPSPLISLDVRTGSLPQLGVAGTTDYLTFFSSDVFGPAIYWDPGKDMRFGPGGASLYNPFGFTEQMRIQSSTGNVGVGTMTPGSKLDVAGDINFTGLIRFQASPLLQLPGGAAQNNVSLGINANSSGTGTNNTAVGFGALRQNTSGSSNTAVGSLALNANQGGGNNTAVGQSALTINQTGANNTAIGVSALASNTSGSNNIAIGANAGQSVSGGNSNNIDIGNSGASGDNGVVRIGNTQTQFFVAGVRGTMTGNNDAVAVMIDSNGQLGTISSSSRFKEDIQDMGEASRGLMSLRPVSFRYKQPFGDGSKPIQYGLIAEEVEQVYPELVAHSADGQIETVKYQALDSMLLNEMQRQDGQIDKLQEKLNEQKRQHEELLDRLSKAEELLKAATRKQ